MKPFEIFCACPPGLEPYLQAEALEAGFKGAEITAGGITFMGLWPNVMRANLNLRGASRVLARFASFRSFNLSQLEKQTRTLEHSCARRRHHAQIEDLPCGGRERAHRKGDKRTHRHHNRRRPYQNHGPH